MTTLVATRTIRTVDNMPVRHQVVVPVARATDDEFDAFFIEQLREYLWRHGHADAHTVATERLLSWVGDLFALPR